MITIKKYKCGCTIKQGQYGEGFLEMCPMHDAAPDLLDACKLTIEHLLWEKIQPRHLKQLEQAIAKATGGEV